MISKLECWINRNCRFAVFNAPNRGDRIELPNRPGEYLLVMQKPEIGTDARGQKFWSTYVKDMDGQEQFLSSDRVPNWKHYSGQNYQWHDERVAQEKFEKEQQEKAQLIEGFESQYLFRDGQPLRANPRRPMAIDVDDRATGELQVFSGERLLIKDVNYEGETVQLEPVNPEMAEFSSALQAVSAGEVVRFCAPTMRVDVRNEPVRLPTGQVVTADDMMRMTPGLNELARRGQVELRAQVYQNYENAKGMGGEEYFANEMGRRNIATEDVQELTQYRLNQTPAKLGPDGKRTNIFGAWSGDVYISPPISKQVEQEISSIAPMSKIQKRRDGTILVQSNSLYKQMVSLGVLEEKLVGAGVGA